MGKNEENVQGGRGKTADMFNYRYEINFLTEILKREWIKKI